MTRLRGAYDAMHQTWPLSSPPDLLVDAMQAGDRLGYHPEKAKEEIAHFHMVLPQAKAAIETIGQTYAQRLDDTIKHMGSNKPADLDAQKQHRLDAMARAQKQVNEAGK